jgi:hypothetical protein
MIGRFIGSVMPPLILILILLLVFDGSSGYWAYGPYGGIGIGGIFSLFWSFCSSVGVRTYDRFGPRSNLVRALSGQAMRIALHLEHATEGLLVYD